MASGRLVPALGEGVPASARGAIGRREEGRWPYIFRIGPGRP
jgi:hypothetical protein